MKQRRIAMLILLLAALVAAGAYVGYMRYVAFVHAPLVGAPAGASVEVARGDSFVAVLAKLRAQGVHNGHDMAWQALARQLGAAGRIQVGRYAIDAATTPRSLLLRMRDGKVESWRFTIVEGWNMRDLRAALGRATPLRHAIAELDDTALMAAIGAAGQHPEGRFLPETYAYTSTDSDLDVLKRAHAAMERALDAAWEARAPDTVLADREQALVLASIIEKETGIASERARIGGVFARRLKAGMRLQTDPTVIYGMGSAYAGNIRRADLLADTPYNTYTRDGLPPTPIAMPGVDALNAATQPAAGDELFFVAVGDGSGRHVFSRTLGEHQSAVNDYVRRYRAKFPRQ